MFKRFLNVFNKVLGRNVEEVIEEPTAVVTEPIEAIEEVKAVTLFDCVLKAKMLGLDMRKLNAKIGSMGEKKFISWFKQTYM